MQPDGTGDVNARIVYWGIEGAGKTTNLSAVHAKLRPDHRGELREVPTRLDPSVGYEVLPIELGDIAGVHTQIQIVSLPGTPEQAPTRKQLLDRVDGIVLVIDSQSQRVAENIESFEELRGVLAAYGRSLADVPLVVQYNKRDLADPYALEELHRKLDLRGVAVFEAVATEGTGVLQTLSTISKKVIRTLRDREHSPALPPLDAAPASPEPAETLAPGPDALLEDAILAEPEHPEADEIAEVAEHAEAILDGPWDPVAGEVQRPADLGGGANLSIVSVGEAQRAGDRAVRIPLVLGDTDGQTTDVVLTIQIDPLLGENLD